MNTGDQNKGEIGSMVKKREIQLYPPGGKKTLKLAILEAGAKVLQDPTPLKDFDIYVVGFHCARQMPDMQMEAHHYCKQVNEDFLQCVVFDGNTENANLIGVEYIISERLFGQLPHEEHQYWHPHNYEILSGVLVAPGLPAEAVLAWSFNRDGELDPELLADSNQGMEIDTTEKRSQRMDLVELAHPQEGVNVLKGQFPEAEIDPPPGVMDKSTGW